MRTRRFASTALVILSGCAVQSHQESAATSHVPDTPPDSVPTAIWNAMYAQGNMEQSSPEWGTPFPRNIVLVMFREEATQTEKQRAVDAIRGFVVGGAPIGRGGFYYIRIRDDGTSAPLFRAIRKLKQLPQIELATPDLPDVSPLGQKTKAPQD